eukprot:TRINITY_DN7202_c0_g1_i2.p1 TRINITY_DN7202_c0_g1~~TRINITY_DN7202_c0_g1_i2.p1  ORF type:complete len:180 (+),score=22.44 TRINITY_DN7202_c0_g1_i2:71-541(+)
MSTSRQPFTHNGRVIYEWEQTLDEVLIYIQTPDGVRGRDLDIKISPNHLSVGIKGNPPYLNEDLGGTADVSASLWTLDDGELTITLQKAQVGAAWLSGLQGHGQLDEHSRQEVQKKLMLERFQREHPQFDFSNATFTGQAPDARTFMGGIDTNKIR